ncbi:hypothetical protein OG735_39670 [Streptomyces sp. NBC_01210]|nr:hypothetical protein OG735_39670 [Streptomyces sp. NBC_01210]
MNGEVERSHRIDAEEFYRLLDGVIIDDARVDQRQRHNSAWGTGASLLGPAPLWILPHLRRIVPARSAGAPARRRPPLRGAAAQRAGRGRPYRHPVLLLAGSDNGLWLDSQKLCHEVLAQRQSQLDVAYTEIPGYGHPDTSLGRGAALDVFGHIFDFLGKRR